MGNFHSFVSFFLQELNKSLIINIREKSSHVSGGGKAGDETI